MISKIAKIPAMANLYRTIAPYVLRSKIVDCGSFKMKLVANGKVSDIATVVMMNGYYERATTTVFKRILKYGDTVVDVGANTGYFSLLSSYLVGPAAGRVFSFEPEPNNMETLRQNINLNGFINIYPYQMALSNHTGKVVLHTSSGDSRNSLIKSKYHVGSIPVNVDKLSNILSFKPKLIKVDTEGNELAVLKGALVGDYLIVEIGLEDTEVDQLWDFVHSIGMRRFLIIDDYHDTIDFCDNLESLKKSCNNPSQYVNLLCKR